MFIELKKKSKFPVMGSDSTRREKLDGMIRIKHGAATPAGKQA
jgi:hypothetical protein